MKKKTLAYAQSYYSIHTYFFRLFLLLKKCSHSTKKQLIRKMWAAVYYALVLFFFSLFVNNNHSSSNNNINTSKTNFKVQFKVLKLSGEKKFIVFYLVFACVRWMKRKKSYFVRCLHRCAFDLLFCHWR